MRPIASRPVPFCSRDTVKLCYVCGEYPPARHGGIGTMVQLLARGMAAAGHSVRVVGVRDGDADAPSREVDEGVDVWRLPERRAALGWLRSRRELYRVVAEWSRAGEVDLVEVPDWQGWAAGWPSLPVPVIVRLNGSVSYFQGEAGRAVPRAIHWIERTSLRRGDACCAVSRYTAVRTSVLLRTPVANADVLHNPVDARRLAAPLPFAERSRTRVVFSGTLTEKKGIRSLLEAWPAVVAAVPGAELDIYGKDARANGIESMRAHLEQRLPPALRAGVRFHGHVARETVLAALRSARAAVFPSYSEACALAPIEAMAAGCPVIHTRLSSGPEVVREDVDGLLVDPRAPAEISAALVRLLTDDELARRLGIAGPTAVRERFSLEDAIARNVAFYEAAQTRFHAKRHGRNGRRSGS